MDNINQSIPVLVALIVLAICLMVLSSFIIERIAVAYAKWRWRRTVQNQDQSLSDADIIEQMYN